jgi:hypothetical protein
LEKVVTSHDVEAGVKGMNPTAGQPAVENPSPQSGNEKEPSGTMVGNEADDSTLPAYDDKDDFPEGGLKAWLVVCGSFCGSFAVFGIINSTAILLEYFSSHQLKDYSPSQIGWIFGLSLFLTFFCGAPIGPIFDAYGPRTLILAGSILLVASMFLLGLCTRKASSQYWLLHH